MPKILGYQGPYFSFTRPCIYECVYINIANYSSSLHPAIYIYLFYIVLKKALQSTLKSETMHYPSSYPDFYRVTSVANERGNKFPPLYSAIKQPSSADRSNT